MNKIIYDFEKNGFSISTNKLKLDLEKIHHYLSLESYWAKDIPMETVKRSIENSICFGVYLEGQQIGFARVISDLATFAYLADVFIVEGHRGKGLSKWLVEIISNLPELQNLRDGHLPLGMPIPYMKNLDLNHYPSLK